MSEDLERPNDQTTDAEDAAEGEVPSDETVSSETQGKDAAGRGRHVGRWIVAALTVALIAALAVSNVVLWRRSTEASDDLARLRRQVANFSVDLSCSSFGGSGAADELCGRIDAAQSEAADAQSAADDAQSAVEDMASCVNVYMETIARWSSNISSRYTYKRC